MLSNIFADTTSLKIEIYDFILSLQIRAVRVNMIALMRTTSKLLGRWHRLFRELLLFQHIPSAVFLENIRSPNIPLKYRYRMWH